MQAEKCTKSGIFNRILSTRMLCELNKSVVKIGVNSFNLRYGTFKIFYSLKNTYTKYSIDQFAAGSDEYFREFRNILTDFQRLPKVSDYF